MSVESRRRARKKWKQNNREKDKAWQRQYRAKHRIVLVPILCVDCKQIFTPSRSNVTFCSSCRRLRNNLRVKEWFLSHPNAKFEGKLARYGLTSEKYFKMLKDQDERCAICKKDNPQTSWGSWHIDHDHNCCGKGRSCGKCVRGLLCHKCNSGLGNFNDDPSIMTAAIRYVAESKEKQRGLS